MYLLPVLIVKIPQEISFFFVHYLPYAIFFLVGFNEETCIT